MLVGEQRGEDQVDLVVALDQGRRQVLAGGGELARIGSDIQGNSFKRGMVCGERIVQLSTVKLSVARAGSVSRTERIAA